LYSKEMVEEAMNWARGNSVDVGSDAGQSIDTETESPSVVTKAEGLIFDKDDTILLVDNDMDMRRYIKQFFSPLCRIIEASNGEEAFEMARSSPPDLILSDFMMTRMNGQELLQAIRQDPTTRNIPMVLLSASIDDESRLSALTTGVDDFMSKPFKPKELIARVHLQMHLGKRRIKLEALFAQREREISLLSDYCPSGIIRQTADGTTTYGNAVWREYVGMTDEDDLDIWLTRVDPSYAGSLAGDLEDFYRGDANKLQRTWKWLDGRTVAGTFTRLDKAIPGMTGVMGSFSDITDQEERVLEAERRRIEAEEAKQQQELLVDFTSHEIRTPVSAILQCASFVKQNLEGLKAVLEGAMRSEGSPRYVPSVESLIDIEHDIEALNSESSQHLQDEKVVDRLRLLWCPRYLPVWPCARKDRKRYSVLVAYPARHTQPL
jgi:CheY-like chemotaxis protein